MAHLGAMQSTPEVAQFARALVADEDGGLREETDEELRQRIRKELDEAAAVARIEAWMTETLGHRAVTKGPSGSPIVEATFNVTERCGQHTTELLSVTCEDGSKASGEWGPDGWEWDA
jgi:hypothetical protein